MHQLNSLKDVAAQAHSLAANLKGGDILLLTGELGTGKTTFVQNLAQALGVTTSVTSPTFTIAAEYKATKHPQISKLVHLDLYRLSDKQAQNESAVREVLNKAIEPNRLTIIEWADKLGISAPADAYTINFAHGANKNQRLMTISHA